MATTCFLLSVICHGRGKLPKRKVTVMIVAVFFNVKLYFYQEKKENTSEFRTSSKDIPHYPLFCCLNLKLKIFMPFYHHAPRPPGHASSRPNVP